MARILNEQLMKKLQKGGDWELICKEAIDDPDLSPEIRDGKLIVYFQKGKILTLEGKKNALKFYLKDTIKENLCLILTQKSQKSILSGRKK